MNDAVSSRTTTDRHSFVIREYRPGDLRELREFWGIDDFAWPLLSRKFPGLRRYQTDCASYYYRHEPESLFVAVAGGRLVGTVSGAVDTARAERVTERVVLPGTKLRLIMGRYGFPVWMIPLVRTDLAKPLTPRLEPDPQKYPAHLHIGVVSGWRRRGVGTALVKRFRAYLRERGVPGFHIHASSFHPQGMAFFHKLGLQALGQFDWPLFDGAGRKRVTETLFVSPS